MRIPAPDRDIEAAARARQGQLTKPAGSLGRLEDLACWLAARLGDPVPAMPQCEVFVFAGDHGVAARGVSAYPQAVTFQMLQNFAAGGAAINVLARLESALITVVDVGVASEAPAPAGVRNERIRAGTRDLGSGAAMTAAECAAARAVGERCVREAAARGTRLLIAGDMGIANTTAASCLICAYTGTAPHAVVGRGTGIDDETLARKRALVESALARAAASGLSRPEAPREAADEDWAERVLAQFGGYELAAMTGFYIAAARQGIPVLLDGYLSAAAALAAIACEPPVVDWLMASHLSAEAGHALALQALKLSPLIDLGLRLGEGTGAALALSLVRAGLALHREMATFSSAGVSTSEAAAAAPSAKA